MRNPVITPTHHNYAYFKQFDWLEKCFTLNRLNSMSKSLGTIFLPAAPNMYNNVYKNKILMAKLGLYGFTQFVSNLPQFTH